MTTRLLATIEGVFCAVPLRDHLSNLITHTQYLADRNIYAAVLTRQQWDKLREEYWATGRQCDHGRLVPDIDFVASDGKSFLDFEACRKHEATLAKPAHLPDYAERAEFIAAKICADVMQYNNGEFCNAATEHRFQDWLWSKSQVGEEGAAPSPATISTKISGPGLSGKEPLTEEAFMNETKPCMSSVGLHSDRSVEIKTTPDGPPVTLTTDSAPPSLEDRMLVVVGSNYMNIGLVASLLKTDENAVRAVAESSGKFKLSVTGKSITKN